MNALSRRLLGVAFILLATLVALGGSPLAAATFPAPQEGQYVIRDFRFASGQSLPELRMHYRTLGTLRRGEDGKVNNAVLILHGTGGQGGNFVTGNGAEQFAAELFSPGQPLDAQRFFIVLPDNIGHGKSSKPSDGLKAGFPAYRYEDMIRAQHQLLTEGLGVDHLYLVMGTSMGGMHTWLWGSRYPDFVDYLMPLASLPGPISGRNRAWRKMVSEAIRTDPEWQGGNYEKQPRSLRVGVQMLYLMSSNPVIRQKEAPTGEEADRQLEAFTQARMASTDANDLLYAIEASADYDPGPGLGTIKAPLYAVNTADDLINPPELGILEREIQKVERGKAFVLPLSPETVGHSSHTKATLWKHLLVDLLSQKKKKGCCGRS